MLNFVKQRSWSPYLSGIILGMLQVPVFLLVKGSIGTSAATGNVACSVVSMLKNENTTCFALPKSWWQLGFVVGIILGAYISKTLSNNIRQSISKGIMNLIPNYSLVKRLIFALIGGFLFMLGARLADGCTSGNGISGIALLSVGSMLVIAAMFVVGVIVSKILYKNINKRGQ